MVTEIKKLLSKEDLTRIVAGDVVRFGVWNEECLCYGYQGLKEGELFFLSRFKETGREGYVGVIFEHKDNLIVEGGHFNIDPFNAMIQISDAQFYSLKDEGYSDEEIGKMLVKNQNKTQDGLFNPGVRLITQNKEDKEYFNLKKYNEFNQALMGAKL